MTTGEIRREALQKFILGLSDQQLVTGLAILITGYSERCSITAYHFTIVSALAWLSSTTHLSTLAVLQDYLIHHPIVKTWRTIGMLCMLGMLFYALLITQLYYSDYKMPIQCIFNNTPWGQNTDGEGTATFIFFDFGIPLFLLFAYGNSIVPLYSRHAKVGLLGWVAESLRGFWDLKPRPSNISRLRTGLASGFRNRMSPRSCLYFSLFFFSEYLDSFLWQITWLFFGNVFGITQIYCYRWANRPAVHGDENSMGFGQIVPLLLIALPILAAGEVLYGILLRSQDSFFVD